MNITENIGEYIQVGISTVYYGSYYNNMLHLSLIVEDKIYIFVLILRNYRVLWVHTYRRYGTLWVLKGLVIIVTFWSKNILCDIICSQVSVHTCVIAELRSKIQGISTLTKRHTTLRMLGDVENENNT